MGQYSFDDVKKKRNDYFDKWDAAYNQTKNEIDELINNFDEIKKLANAITQDLTINFYTIHLCNFFFFHVRKRLVEKCRNKDGEYFLTNGFSNNSWLPPDSIMDQLLSFLINDVNTFRDYREKYIKILKIRNKYAHGATNEATSTLTFDEYKTIYEDILKI